MTSAIMNLILLPARHIFNKVNLAGPIIRYRIGAIHTTCCRPDLTEFLEKKTNWGKQSVKSGRSWKLDELRIKSNDDLHKLWYILYKEKNMLLTMEHFCKENYVLFPSPERIDKVEESMKNLETVVRERNKAYYMLETGVDGEQPSSARMNALGMLTARKATQHCVPEFMNTWFKKNFFFSYNYEESREFMKMYRERLRKQNTYMRRIRTRYVRGILRRFRNVDLEAVKKAYPDVNLDNIKNGDPIRGHWCP